jgi:hypothetical protein
VISTMRNASQSCWVMTETVFQCWNRSSPVPGADGLQGGGQDRVGTHIWAIYLIDSNLPTEHYSSDTT